MNSPRDPIDDWLQRDVTPLSPPPGSLDRIRQRARRRKTRQATLTAAGCAVVLAAAIATPQLLSAGQPSGHASHPPLAIGSSSAAPGPSGVNTPAPDASTKSQLSQHTTLSNSWTVPPPNFQPTSVTFVGAENGTNGVVGAVIGQAGTPGSCATADCTSLAGTTTYGASWYGVSAPVAPGPDGSTGVSQLRFASLSDGWAYGPALYETSHGGYPWHQESTDGQRVLDLEAAPAHQSPAGVTVPARAYAVFGTCTGAGADYTAGCTSFSLWTSVAGSRTWTAVGVPAAYQHMAAASPAAGSGSPATGSPSAPLLVISGGTTGYLLTPSGEMLSGPTTGGSWHAIGTAPCAPGTAGAAGTAGTTGTTGQPAATGAQLAAGPALLLTCDTPVAGGGYRVALYSSSNGQAWPQGGSVTVPATPTSLASASAGQAVLATTAGIEYSASLGSTWRAASFTGTVPAGGFSYVGMTNGTQGVAVPADSQSGDIWVTSDGGRTWAASPVSG